LVQESMPAPLLALIEPADRDTTGTIPPDFATLGRNIHLVPVREQLVPSAAVVPFGRTTIVPERAASRMLWRDNRWQPDSSIRGSNARDYEFVAHLPPGYNALRPNQLQVRFAADNRGRNLEFAVFLKDRNAPKPTPATKSKAKPAQTDDEDAPPPTEGLIPATRTANEVFYFEDLAGRDILDPTDGQFTIVVRARPLQAYNDNIQQLSFNTWVVIAFDVAAAGTLPPETTGTR
jgi:hypothetical protein